MLGGYEGCGYVKFRKIWFLISPVEELDGKEGVDVSVLAWVAAQEQDCPWIPAP